MLLIIGLLVFGLVGLLLLNTATASSSFRERSLQDRNNALTLRQQALQREVSAMDAPQALAKAAAGLGMVPGPDPAFLELLKNGSSKIIGDPGATADPVPPPPAPTATPTPTQRKTTQHKATQHKATQHKATQHKATNKPTPGTASSPPAHHTTAAQHQQAHGGHR
ncbi:MAG TPA: hypothetical protein VHX59_06755 [Mycobacteriales bacterium]|nr:hypothetical protein [Mycobacteriales bacterium]